MATVTHRTGNATSADGSSYASNSFTPAEGDLLVVFVAASNTAADATVTASANGVSTFHRVDRAAFSSSAHSVYAFVAEQLVGASPASMTVTFDCTGDDATGRVLHVASVSGLSKLGAAAVRQSAKITNGAASTTPTYTFAAACLTENPTLAITAETSTSGLGVPTGWTEGADASYLTPTIGAAYVHRASGFTGTTITYPGTETAHGGVAVELNTHTAVTSTRSTTWDTRAQVAASRSTSWDALAAVASSRSTSWNVENEGTVLSNRSTTWDVRTSTTSDRATTWDTRAATPSQRATTWDTRAAVTAQRSTSWHVIGPVASSRSTTWDTLAAVTRSRSTLWNVGAEILVEGVVTEPTGIAMDSTAPAEATPPVTTPPAGLTPAVGRRWTAAAFTTPTIAANGHPAYTAATAETARHRIRIIVDGVDVTWLRDVPTPAPSWQLIQPCTYGPGRLELPQVHPHFETPGAGALAWLRPFAPVRFQLVNAGGTVVDPDLYRGVIMSIEPAGTGVLCALGGEISGPASVRWAPLPVWRTRNDAGYWIWEDVRAFAPTSPNLGITTGIVLTNLGGMWMWDRIIQRHAMAQRLNGQRFTTEWDPAAGEYVTRVKDTTTIAATVYADQSRIEARLNRDFTAEPNRVFATAVAPSGMIVNGAVYPGLIAGDMPPYPFADGRVFGEGTTDEDADQEWFDGVISAMLWRLTMLGFLDREDVPGGYDADVTEAVRDAQAAAGLAQTGNMNPATWDALYDVGGVLGYDRSWSQILPMAQQSRVRYWNRTPSGIPITVNPAYDPTVVKVDRVVDIGVGFKPPRVREFARQLLQPDAGGNWTGEIALNGLALVAGNHTPGAAIGSGDVFPPTSLRPGMNLRLPLYAGGITVHVSAVAFDRGGDNVTVAVDTQARDSLEVWEIIARNREARRNPAAEFRMQLRSSASTRDGMVQWNHACGKLDSPKHLAADQWNVFPVVAGQEGEVRRISIRLRDSQCEFAVAIFGQEITPGWLANRIPNPLGGGARADWIGRFEELRQRTFLFGAGTQDNPCGYSPGIKRDEDGATGDPITGNHEDDTGFPYYTASAGAVIWVAIWPRQACWVKAGRLFYAQLADQVT